MFKGYTMPFTAMTIPGSIKRHGVSQPRKLAFCGLTRREQHDRTKGMVPCAGAGRVTSHGVLRRAGSPLFSDPIYIHIPRSAPRSRPLFVLCHKALCF